MNIMIIHAHTGNRGDEAAVRCVADEILNACPSAELTIQYNGTPGYPNLSNRQRTIERFPESYSTSGKIDFIFAYLFRGRLVFTDNGRKFIHSVKKSDIILHAPGGPSIGDTYYKEEMTYLLRLNLIRRMGIPYMFYSPSMGPFNDKKREKLRKKVLRGAEAVFVRDPISYKYVKEFVPDVDVKLAMDSVFQHEIDFPKYEALYNQYTELKTFVKSHDRCIGLTITDLKWHPLHGKTDVSIKINDTFQKFVDFIIDRGYGIVFIPQLYGTSDDATYMSEFMRAEHTFIISETEDKYDSYFQQYVIGKLYAVVGMRYHSNIFSAKMSTPFVSVSYEQKMRGFMESTELIDYCIDLEDLSYENLTFKFQQVEANYGEYADKLRDLHRCMKKNANIATQAVICFVRARNSKKHD